MTTCNPLADWHEDIGPVLWWEFPVVEPPYVGTRSTSGHRAARVRNNNSKDVERARQVIAALHLWCKEDCHLWMYGYQGPREKSAHT